MSEIDPAQKPEEPAPKFRINAQVFQILGLLGVALAAGLLSGGSAAAVAFGRSQEDRWEE